MFTPGEPVDRYLIEALLGSGGHADVYRVRHATLGTAHALKLLRVADQGLGERLVQEGRIQARLRMVNVVAVTDVITVHGRAGLIMDLVDGPSLQQWITAQLPVPHADADRVFRDIIAGVAAAHREGLTHRDLKPANVLIGPDGVARVTDFGLAKLLGAANGNTRTGQIMGTPPYMSPEQFTDSTHVDARTDIFALGCILYDLYTGVRAFPQPDVSTCMGAVLMGRWIPPERLRKDVPEPVRKAIDGCLEPDRDARIPDTTTLLAVLDARAEPATKRPRELVSFASVSDTIDWKSDLRPEATAPVVAAALPPSSTVTVTAVPGPTNALAQAPQPRSPPARANVRSLRRFGTIARMLPGGILALVAVAVPGLGVTDAADVPLHTALLRRVLPPVPATHTVVVAVDVPANRDLTSLRAEHGRLITDLVAAGVTTIVFDMAFSSPAEGDDAFASAARNAAAAGVPVFLAAHWDRGLVPAGTESLANATTPGCVDLETVGHLPWRFVVRHGDGIGTCWALPVLTAQAMFPRQPGPSLDGDTLQVGAVTNATRLGRAWLAPAADAPVIAYHREGKTPGALGALDARPWAEVDVRGRAALVGSATSGNDTFDLPEGSRFGVQVHARMVETLLAGRAPARASRGSDVARTLVLTLLAWFAGGKSRRFWVGAVLPAPVIWLVYVSARANELIAVAPLLIFPAVAWWMGVRGGVRQ